MAAEDRCRKPSEGDPFLDRYEHKGKFRPFLYQIATNTCVMNGGKEGGAFTGGSGIYRTGIFPVEAEVDFRLLVERLPEEWKKLYCCVLPRN